MVILFAFRFILLSAPLFSVAWKADFSGIHLLGFLALWLPSCSASQGASAVEDRRGEKSAPSPLGLVSGHVLL